MTGKVTSKREALAWAQATLDPVWVPLLTQVGEDRAVPWQPVDPHRPGSLDMVCEFASYIETVA